MIVELQITGGFASLPGLSGPRILDTDTVDETLRDEIESLVNDSRFFDLPAEGDDDRSLDVADGFTYSLAITDGLRRNSIVRMEPVSDRRLARLIEALDNITRPI